jgi:2-keto-4-pentenoate hydratase/2-oxohepta-3-ene-1,7-dioic acid hydratase in catechol pathway
MRLATVKYKNQPRLVVANQEGDVFLLDDLLRSVSSDIVAPKTMLELVERPEEERRNLNAALSAALVDGGVEPIQPESWLPPVVKPGKIIGVAINNGAMARMSYRYFDKPAFFMKAPSSLIGHGEAIKIRPEYGLTHPEPELACVIGAPLSNAKEEDTLKAVFGYTIINDITSPGLKDEDSVHFELKLNVPLPTWRRTRAEDDADIYLTYHARSKCTDTFGPLGPWLVTADEIENPNTLEVKSWLGDKLIAEDSTANLMFSVPQVLSHLSRYMSLEPGDIVHMGTAVNPMRVALREANFQKLQGPSIIEIEKIGRLSNPIEIVE